MYVCAVCIYRHHCLHSLYTSNPKVYGPSYYCCSMGVDSLVVPVLTPMVDIYFCII